MEVSSIERLCLHLISSAFQRCRLSENLCRLSVVLNCSSASDPSLIRISISDTGSGICLEEFNDLTCTKEVGVAEKWDGLLSIQTTSICDYEIHHYNMNIRGNPSEIRLTTLPSISKNGSKFSGTEVSFSVSECIEILLREIKHFFQKMLVLKIPVESSLLELRGQNRVMKMIGVVYGMDLESRLVRNVTADLVVEGGDFPGSRYETVFLASECNVSHFQSSYLECLKSGLEDYVLKHGNSVNTKCDSCFPCRENLKVGSGTAYHREGHKNAGLAMEAVIIINDFPTNPCCRSCSAITEVLYFEDFLPSSIPQSSLNALTSIGWKSYGLTLVSAMDQGGCALLEWGGNVSSYGQINVALHCYHRQLMIPGGHKIQSDQNLMKRAIKLALDDLKEKHEGTLLSENALKVLFLSVCHS
ncbi:type 2 DNA topoisomerase 6 subunit B-like isoform X2 [Carica papaya]|uniref:type 2 DNA topoisomerase 6 subunit B-like isoform X2 n=1 Tax=Carica papaya TaxID=3649 RepID=UPI000B8D0ABD|nr:type 2 DNA topoisomerase 6 subunit B-like isoform X2 [Carica papaya]